MSFVSVKTLAASMLGTLFVVLTLVACTKEVEVIKGVVVPTEKPGEINPGFPN